jgi:hypothetical protein
MNRDQISLIQKSFKCRIKAVKSHGTEQMILKRSGPVVKSSRIKDY